MEFPKDFLFGATLTAHQTEGANDNSDWAHWERQGRLPASAHGADHYSRYEEDFQLAQAIGFNALRISIEWARIEPVEGRWNSDAVEHYKKVLRAMKERGLTRMVVIWDHTLPQWFSERGGFENKEGIEAFARYAWFVAQNLGKEVDLWLTMHEPEAYVNNSYRRGLQPPFRHNLFKSWRVTENLIQAHRAAYRAIKEALGEVPVGIEKNIPYYEAYHKPHPLDRLAAFILRQLDGYILEKIQTELDFIGLNYYFYHRVKFDWLRFYREMNQNLISGQLSLDEQLNRSDLGWLLYPEGIYHVLLSLKKFKKPVYVTGCGLADAADSRREKYLRDTLRWLLAAIGDGVPVKGYFYRSLLDGYEWQEGFKPKFGLVEVDFTSGNRRIRASAGVFKELK